MYGLPSNLNTTEHLLQTKFLNAWYTIAVIFKPISRRHKSPSCINTANSAYRKHLLKKLSIRSRLIKSKIWVEVRFRAHMCRAGQKTETTKRCKTEIGMIMQLKKWWNKQCKREKHYIYEDATHVNTKWQHQPSK